MDYELQKETQRGRVNPPPSSWWVAGGYNQLHNYAFFPFFPWHKLSHRDHTWQEGFNQFFFPQEKNQC